MTYVWRCGRGDLQLLIYQLPFTSLFIISWRWRWSMWGFVIGTFTPHGFKFLRCVFKFMRVRLSVHLLWRKHCPYNTIYFGPILYLWPFFFFSILEIIFLEASRDTHCYCVPSATSFVYSFFLNKDLCMGPEF